MADEIDETTAGWLRDIRRAWSGPEPMSWQTHAADHFERMARELATLKAVPVDAEVASCLRTLDSVATVTDWHEPIVWVMRKFESLARAYAAQSAELAECIKQIREETQRDDPTTLLEWVKAMRLEVDSEFESRAAAEKELDETKELFSKRNKQLREAVVDLLASAHPHPVEHPTMTAAWARATGTLGAIGHDEVTAARTLQSELAATEAELNEVKTAWEASAEAARREAEAHEATKRELAELRHALDEIGVTRCASVDWVIDEIGKLVKASKAGTDAQG